MILKIFLIGIIAVFTSLAVKKVSKESALAVVLVSSVLILYLLYNELFTLLKAITDISSKSGVPDTYLKLVLKVLGIGYLCDFSSSIAKDASENALAGKIEFAGKISIMAISMPLYLDLINLITGLLP